jgi:hypothetical protein
VLAWPHLQRFAVRNLYRGVLGWTPYRDGQSFLPGHLRLPVRHGAAWG